MLVLNIAVIVFIITLVIVGIILYYSVKSSSFPPFDMKCPTYYMVDENGTNCVFNNSLYPSDKTASYPSLAKKSSKSDTTCTNVPISTFYKIGYDKDEILCAKNRWAKRCGVFWDGVSNNSSACFKASTPFSFIDLKS